MRRSLLMPSLFFAVLYWREMRLAHRVGCMALLTVGACLGAGIVGRDLDVLLHQLRTAGVELEICWVPCPDAPPPVAPGISALLAARGGVTVVAVVTGVCPLQDCSGQRHQGLHLGHAAA
jgi:hypothetical protein